MSEPTLRDEPPTSSGQWSITRGRTTLGGFRRSGGTTRLFLKKQLWAWPLIAAVLLAGVAVWLRTRVEGALRANLAGALQAMLETEVTTLRLWMTAQQANATTAASMARVREATSDLIAVADREGTSRLALAESPAQGRLRTALGPWMETYGYIGFSVADARGRVVASSDEAMIGREAPPTWSGILAAARDGRANVSRPYASTVLLRDDAGRVRAGVPTMIAAAPIRGDGGEPIGALGLRIRPEVDFTRVLQGARAGRTGETYAFDARGVLLSESRFDDELKRVGLLPDRDDARSTLDLQLRDPGGDLTRGYRPARRRGDLPLTRPAAAAVAGRPGVDVQGYRDYRGVLNVGAWTWLPEYGFGLVTEMDADEAFHPLWLLRATFWGLFALLVLSSAAIFAFTVVVTRLNRSMRRAALAARQLGQYTLEEKIGQGGMGAVYRGHHAMLRRPTAIKLLDVEKTSGETTARFEREVMLTCQLSHPNTIVIYDYGRTPEGVFYYAMEYLDGLDLDALVRRAGPLPEGRVIHILRQVCGSLAEAHDIGLIHRDIKPANLLLTRRGGLPDFAKLVDFGLVRALDSARQTGLTSANAILGTPLYLAPEAIQSADRADARSDLYALGAVGYFLLTGTPPFDGKSLVEILQKQLNQVPDPPASRLGRLVAADLESILLRCLAKDPEDRPRTARELSEALGRCGAAGSWTPADAEAWWAAVPAEPARLESPPATRLSGPDEFATVVLPGSPS